MTATFQGGAPPSTLTVRLAASPSHSVTLSAPPSVSSFAAAADLVPTTSNQAAEAPRQATTASSAASQAVPPPGRLIARAMVEGLDLRVSKGSRPATSRQDSLTKKRSETVKTDQVSLFGLSHARTGSPLEGKASGKARVGPHARSEAMKALFGRTKKDDAKSNAAPPPAAARPELAALAALQGPAGKSPVRVRRVCVTARQCPAHWPVTGRPKHRHDCVSGTHVSCAADRTSGKYVARPWRRRSREWRFYGKAQSGKRRATGGDGRVHRRRGTLVCTTNGIRIFCPRLSLALILSLSKG